MKSNTFILVSLKEIEAWPESIKIDYARLIELLMDYGPDLRMPHQKHPRKTYE